MFPRHSKDSVEQEMNESREDYVKTIYALKNHMSIVRPMEAGLLTPEQIDKVKPLVDEGKGITMEKLLVEHGFATEDMVVFALN